MKRWTRRIILIVVLAVAGYIAYGHYRAGYMNLPELPNGAHTLSFKNGLRAIVLDPEIPDRTSDEAPRYFRSLSVANRDRKYLGVPFKVQPWFEDAWSWCSAPTPEEKAELDRVPDEFKRSVENARLEAVCKLDVDGTEIVRGLVFSVPRLDS